MRRYGFNKFLSLKRIRQIYGATFFIVFFLLILATDFKHLKGYEVNLFLKIDPLVTITTILSSWTLYRGLALGLITIILTLFLGRFFCSWICPMGLLNQWISNIFNRRRPADDYRINMYRPVYRLKYYILTGLLLLSLAGTIQAGLLDPISLITRTASVTVLPLFHYLTGTIYVKKPLYHGGVLIGIIFVAILFLNRFITRLWCRLLCPLGAMLGMLSRFSIFRIWRDVQRCNDCMKCLRNCHGGCNPHRDVVYSECYLCMNCIDDCPEGAIHYGLQKETSSVQSGIDLNRRRLVETALATVVIYPIMRSTVSASTRAEPEVIRPPGSLPEEDFLKRCLKCGECMRVCPTNAIQPALLEGGFETLWTPILINRIGYCEYNCVLCGHVCPTGAIKPLKVAEKIGAPPYKKPVKIGTAFYDRGRCLPWAMNIECIVCEEVCPTSPKAIWFEHVDVTLRDGKKKTLKRPHVDPQLCIGCGICEYKCPVHDLAAIRVSSIGETRSRRNQLILKLQ
ncbi:MAG TPA: 4Fe-4S binding protein [Nitrospirae bacterium]|nr:4Fe-4S binding protein [Nitrospirota bacterium]